MKTLTISLEKYGTFSKKMWMVEETGEREEQIREIFGTNKIPSAFSEDASEKDVESKLRKLNPDSTIIFKH